MELGIDYFKIINNLEICHMANKKADMAMLLDDVNQI